MGLRDQLQGSLPADLLPLVSDHFTVIGTIAVLSLPEALGPYCGLIARSLVSRRRNITAVLAKEEKLKGESRTARYRLLLGSETITTHRENGFSYRLDVAGSFFAPRLASERKRVTGLVQPGERVLVPFAGVGPFAIPAAARGAQVTAIEKNPGAIRWLRENVERNHVVGNCTVIEGDALGSGLLRDRVFDRIIIPAPYGLEPARVLSAYLPVTIPGGSLHLYTFMADNEIPAFSGILAAAGLTIRSTSSCGNVAPGIRRRVFEMVR